MERGALDSPFEGWREGPWILLLEDGERGPGFSFWRIERGALDSLLYIHPSSMIVVLYTARPND
jgi:hypothetical protein